MTPAKKSPVFNTLFWRYIRSLLRRQFHSLRVRISRSEGGRPTLYIANHNTWWDGFFVFALNELLLQQDLYLMMGEEQFRKFSFFRRLGVFSIDLQSRSDIAAAFRYSVQLLQRHPRIALWIFPSGDMQPAGAPAAYKDGFARIAAAAGDVDVIPVAMRTLFVDAQHPDVFLAVGDPIRSLNRPADTIFSESIAELERLLGETDRRIQARDFAAFRMLLPGRSSVSTRYARLKGLE